MDAGEATPSRPGPWRRPWVRRLTYLLVGGAVLAGVAAWTVRRPFVTAWLLREADRAVREETGLALEVGDLDLSLLRGRVVLRRVAWGGDFLRVARLDLRVDPWSLLRRQPRILSCEVESPRLRLDRAALARLRFRPRPPAAEPLKVTLGTFTVRDGLLEVREPAWNLPQATLAFAVDGRGLGPNHATATLRSDRLAWTAGGRTLLGQVRIEAEASERSLRLRAAELVLGRSRVALEGGADLPAGGASRVVATGLAHLDLPETAALASLAGLAGTADLRLGLTGTWAEPAANLDLRGQEAVLPGLPLGPGTFHLQAKGSPHRVQVTALSWEGAEGRLQAEGEWRRGAPATLRASVQELDLGAAASRLKLGFLREYRGACEAEVRLPLERSPRLDRLAGSARLSLARGGQPAGQVALTLADGALELQDLGLHLPELDLEGRGRARLSARGIAGLEASGRVRTEAAEVARALKAWDIADLDMSGRVDAQATVAWDASQGLRLDGSGAVTGPRWQGARADRVTSEVQIRGTALRVTRTELFKGEGRAWGDLWLDWGTVRPGADTLDLCYRAHRLPVAEGLKAADDGRNGVGALPISGLGSAWARIRGDWDHLRLTGEAVLEDGRAYGLRLPAGRASLDYDLGAGRLSVPDFRLAETPGQLGDQGTPPEGFLALQGALDMDLKRETWRGKVAGRLDSTLLDLPGPRFQATVNGGLDGPWLARFGPLDLPSGWADFSEGRLFVGDQSVENLKGGLRLQEGRLRAEVGTGASAQPLLTLEALHLGTEARGAARLRLDPAAGDTGRLAQRLTGDLLLDAALDLGAEGRLGPEGLSWQGRFAELTGFFQGFTLAQARPGTLVGSTAGARLDLSLEGRPSAAVQGAARPDQEPTARLGFSGLVPFSDRAPTDLRVTGTGELANLKTILDHLLDLEHAQGLLADLQPRGRASLDLRATGTFADPSLVGTLDLVDGRLGLRGLPQGVEGVRFRLRFNGREFLLPEEDPLVGTFAQGSLGLWGRASWSTGGLDRYAFSARLDDFLLRDVPQGFELQGTLDASLSGDDRSGGVLRGSLRAERMAYQTDIRLGDLILGSPLGSAPELSGLDPDDPLRRIDLDLDLVLAQPWDVDTNLLKIKGRPEGAFKVLGTLARPGLKGRMEFLPGGRITNLLPAGDLVLERGSINFIDPSVVNPVLSAEGRIDVPPFLVTLAINGTLDQLNFVPTSTPSLRQDEIIAVLVDPALAQTLGTSTGTGSQSSMNYGLASASSGLLTTLAFANFGETLRKTLKLDRVNPMVRTGTTGTLESSLTLGKTFEFFGSRTPIIGTYSRSGSQVTLSGKVEWRFGNFVLQFGASGANDGTGVNPTGEIRHTWSPR